MTFIKLEFVIKIFVLSNFEWRFYTDVTVPQKCDYNTVDMCYNQELWYRVLDCYKAFARGFNTVFWKPESVLNKIVMPLFGAAYQIKAPYFYTDFLKLISLVRANPEKIPGGGGGGKTAGDIFF